MNISVHPATEVVKLSSDRTQLRGIARHITIAAPNGLIDSLIALCDGTRDRTQIIETLSDKFPSDKLALLLDTLSKSGAVVESNAMQFADRYEAMADRRRRRGFSVRSAGDDVRPLSQMRLALLGHGAIREALCTELTAVGVQPSDEVGSFIDADIVLAVCDTPDHEEFRKLNRHLVLMERPALYVSLSDEIIRVGPFVDPPATACFECYHHRLRSHIAHRAEFDARTSGQGFSNCKPSGLMARWAATLAVAIVTNWVHGTLLTHGTGQIVEISAFKLTMERYCVLKLPRCTVCGRASPTKIRAPIYEYGI